jgi:hypothetical protein
VQGRKSMQTMAAISAVVVRNFRARGTKRTKNTEKWVVVQFGSWRYPVENQTAPLPKSVSH